MKVSSQHQVFKKEDNPSLTSITICSQDEKKDQKTTCKQSISLTLIDIDAEEEARIKDKLD